MDCRVQNNPLLRFLTSHTWLVFFYGIFLFAYELKIARELVPVVHPFLIAWAGALGVYDLLFRQLWKKIPFWLTLFAFAAAAAVTAVVNRETGLSGNLKSLVLVVLPLVAFLPASFMEPKENRHKAFLKSLLGAAVLMFLASLAALVMYLMRVSETVTIMGITTLIGRRYYHVNDPTSGVLLYGLYEDTNHAAAYALVVAVYSVLLLLSCRKGLFQRAWQNRLGQVFAVANMVVQLCYFPLANSRGGWLCLVVAGLIGVFLYCYFGKKLCSNHFLKAIASAGISVVCVLVLCGALLGLRTGFSAASAWIAEIEASHQTQQQNPVQEPGGQEQQPGTEELPPEQEHTPPPEDTFTKNDETMGSGRITIWKESLRLFSKKPILGIGPDNSQYYAQQYQIGDLLPFGAAMHNSYIDLLVDYGIMGFVALIVFWVACLWTVMRCIVKHGKKLSLNFWLCAFTVLLIAGVAAFLSCMFVNTTAMYLLILVFTSYLMAQCRDKEVTA